MNDPRDLFALAARKYYKYPGNPERVYRALCAVLSERAAQVDWAAFEEADWRILKPMAETEGVAPLMWRKLRHWLAASPTDVPQAVQTLLPTLAPAYYKTLAHNTLLLNELNRVLAAFDEAGIPVIVLKGAALAQTVYKDIGLRPMNDLDLLVRPEDVRKAVKAVQGLGFTPLIYNYARYHVLLHNHEVAIELHWNVIDAPPVQYLWEDLEPLPFRSPSWALKPDLQRLYLAAHLFWQHREWIRLLWLYDLALLWQAQAFSGDARRPEFDRWMHALANAVHALRVYLHFPIPEMREAADEYIPQVVSAADSTALRLVKVWRSLDWRSRLHMLWRQVIFPSPAYMRWRYTIRYPLLTPLYYPYRWWNLVTDMRGA